MVIVIRIISARYETERVSSQHSPSLSNGKIHYSFKILAVMRRIRMRSVIIIDRKMSKKNTICRETTIPPMMTCSSMEISSMEEEGALHMSNSSLNSP